VRLVGVRLRVSRTGFVRSVGVRLRVSRTGFVPSVGVRLRVSRKISMVCLVGLLV